MARVLTDRGGRAAVEPSKAKSTRATFDRSLVIRAMPSCHPTRATCNDSKISKNAVMALLWDSGVLWCTVTAAA